MFQEYTSPMFLFITVTGARFAPTSFILFVTISVFRVMSTILQTPTVFILFVSIYTEWCPRFCKHQRFISVYCQFVFLSGACATTDVGRTSRREFTLVRKVRNTAVSRRLRKTDWCFYSVFVQATKKSKPPIPKNQPFHFSFALMIYTNVPYFSFTLFFLIALPMALLVF